MKQPEIQSGPADSRMNFMIFYDLQFAAASRIDKIQSDPACMFDWFVLKLRKATKKKQ